MSKNNWNYDILQKEALKYQSRQQFNKNNPRAYKAAYRKNLLDEICSHMAGNIMWDKEMIYKEALKYDTRANFQKLSPKAYEAARKRKLLDDVCVHMLSMNNSWTHESLKTEALKYNSRKEFSNNNKKAYEAAYRKNILDEICTHMKTTITYWTNNQLKKEALKYNSRWEFGRLNKSAYQAAHKRKIMDDICSHMTIGINGFNPESSGTVYYIKIESNSTAPIYKIGITNLMVHERIKSMEIYKDFTIKILAELFFENGKDAVSLEKELHKQFKEHQYNGDKIMKNGNTELYNIDVLNLDGTLNSFNKSII